MRTLNHRCPFLTHSKWLLPRTRAIRLSPR